MQTRQPCPRPSPTRLLVVFAILFVTYQLPQGLEMMVKLGDPARVALRVMFLPVAWLCGRMLGFRGLDAWFLALTPRWGLFLGACFALSLVAKTTAVAIGTAAGVYSFAMPAAPTPQAVLFAALECLVFFFPSIAEDIVTRGFLMRALPGLARRWSFVVVSAALFVLNHIYRLANGPYEWAMIFCMGLAYAAALYYTGTLWAAVGLHWGWNYAVEFIDRVAQVDPTAPGLGPLTTSVTHLIVLAIVILAARRNEALASGKTIAVH
jgi:membrane protease YdiL (CAAX protease family)